MKCTNVINNVIGPYFYEILVKDIGDGYYSLLIDESTDITVNKMLGIAIRYYSVEQKRIVSTFLSLIHIEDGTAESIVSAIKKILIYTRMQLIKMQGIGRQCIDDGRGKFRRLRAIEGRRTSSNINSMRVSLTPTCHLESNRKYAASKY